MLIKEMNSSTYDTKEEFVNLIDKVTGSVTTKKIVKKRKGASSGPCEPGFDDFSISTYSNNKKRIAMRMLGHQKYVGLFENKEDSKEAISMLIKEMNSSTYDAKEEFVNLIDKVMGLATTKKTVKKKKDANNGPCKPRFNNFSIRSYSNNKMRITMCMFGHQKHAGIFKNKENSKEVISVLIEETNSSACMFLGVLHNCQSQTCYYS